MTRVLTSDEPNESIVEIPSTSQNVKRPRVRDITQILPGAPMYDVADFGAVGNGSTDDTAALNAAIAAANAVPGTVYLMSRHRITAPLTPIGNNNVWVKGRGPFNGGTIILCDSPAAIDALAVTNCQYSGFSDFWIAGQRAFTSGWAIRLSGTFRCGVIDVLITNFANGVDIGAGCLLTDIDRVNLSDLYGFFGFFAQGTSSAFCHAVRFYDCVAGTDFPLVQVGPGSVWATSTAYVVGNIVFANGFLWQCAVAGVSAGAGPGPAGLPSTNPALVHTTQVVDGSARWRFAMPLNSWWLHSSYCNTFEVVDCGALQGGYGISVEDLTPGAGSTPLFTRSRNFQADHVFSRGIRMLAGRAGRHYEVQVGAMLEGCGIEVGPAYGGNWEFCGGEIFGCNREGALLNASDGILHGLQIGACGVIAANTVPCISVGFNASRLSITDCSAGVMADGNPATSNFGLRIFAGSDNYLVENNRFVGNLTAPVLNSPGTSSTRIVRNNVPCEQATISVVVPAVAAATLAYLDVAVGATALAGVTTADTVVAQPAADLAAAGAGAGFYVGCRVSAANTVRLTFQGLLAGGAVNFNFVKVN